MEMVINALLAYADWFFANFEIFARIGVALMATSVPVGFALMVVLYCVCKAFWLIDDWRDARDVSRRIDDSDA